LRLRDSEKGLGARLVLRVKARLVGTSCELERVGCAWGFQGGGYFVTREKGQGQWRGGGRMGYFWKTRKESIGKANNG